MSTSTVGVTVPEWDLADRLAKALKVANMSVQEMADYLDVHRNTVSAWINGRTSPGTQSIRLWAIRTGVPFEWLINDEEPPRRRHSQYDTPSVRQGLANLLAPLSRLERESFGSRSGHLLPVSQVA